MVALASVGATGQTLSVAPIEAKAGYQATLTVNVVGAAAMTDLQFNLSLPEGMTLADGEATMGAATDGHTLAVETLANGDHLFVLYSMDLNTLRNGELLRIPVNVGSEGADGSVRLYTVRMADAEAVSHLGEEASAIVTAIKDVATEYSSKSEGDVYDLSGQRVTRTGKGVYIIDGRKVVKSRPCTK